MIEHVLVDGDEQAFRALYRRHTAPVYRYVLRMVDHDEHEAEGRILSNYRGSAPRILPEAWRPSAS